jgi:hypothetical protein
VSLRADPGVLQPACQSLQVAFCSQSRLLIPCGVHFLIAVDIGVAGNRLDDLGKAQPRTTGPRESNGSTECQRSLSK